MAEPTTPSAEMPIAPPPAPRRTRVWLIALAVAIVVIVAGAGAYVILSRPPGVKVVTYAVTSEMVTLDPSTEFSNSIIVLAVMYESLAYFDHVANEPKPWLAESWTKTADGLNWTFTLRRGVTFHDGTPFNAAAVKFSVERTIAMGEGAYYIWDSVKSIEVVSEYVVKFVLSYSAPLDWIAASSYAAWIFSPNTPGALDAGGPNYTKMQKWFNEGHDSGTGPYRLADTDDWRPTARVILTANEGYWDGRPFFDFAVVRVTEDPIARELAVVEGDADITADIPVQDVSTLREDPSMSVHTGPSYRTMYAFFNNARSPTSSLLVRQALAYAIPYADIVNTVVNQLGTQSSGVIPKGMWGHNATLPKYAFDLARADQLLDQAGYTTTPRFTLNLTYTAGDPYEEGFAGLYKEKLATLGITLNVQPMPWVQQWDRAKSDPAKAQDIFVMYWWPDIISPYSFLWGMFHSETEPVFNMGYYYKAEFDAIIDAAVLLEATDRDEAFAMYSDAQHMLYQDVPAVGILDLNNVYLMKAGLRGFVDNPAYQTVVFFHRLSR